MKSITQDDQNDKKLSSSIKHFFKQYKVYTALNAPNAYKHKGISVVVIFEYLFCLIFTHRSMYMNMIFGKNESGFRKYTVYRFLNSTHINWMRFTTLLCSIIVSSSIGKLTDDNRVNVLILDDSMFERASSKKVEQINFH